MAEPQPRRRWVRLVPALWLVAILAGCSGYLTEEGDPSAPILVRGRVVDASGGGMSGATVRLLAEADVDAGAGAVLPAIELGSFRAGLDGAFVVRLAPTAELEDLADRNGGAVIFTLVAFEGLNVPFAFSRDLVGGTWAGDVPTVEFAPDGATGDGVGSRALVPVRA